MERIGDDFINSFNQNKSPLQPSPFDQVKRIRRKNKVLAAENRSIKLAFFFFLCYKETVILDLIFQKFMPIKKAAKKFMRVTKRKVTINKKTKEALRLSLKETHIHLKASDVKSAKDAYQKAQQKIDKAAKAGLIKKNTAARKKSRLAKKIKVLEKK